MIALLIALLFMPVVFPLSEWIVRNAFDAAERLSRYRGRICL